MSQTTYRAPGKIVLLGEYAVLDGAPSLVAALDHGVQCRFVDESATLQISTPTGDSRFATAAMNRAGVNTGRWIFADWNPLQLGDKAGFGGSAAATVCAYTAALAHTGQRLNRDNIFTVSLEVHRAVQGSGSGVDIAAAVYGGILKFQYGTTSAMPELSIVAVWSGLSAKTGPRVEQYLKWSQRDAFIAEMTQLVETFYEAPVERLAEGMNLLTAMANQAKIPYLTDSLAEIARLAKVHGGAAKPSGAGGGDCAIAIFRTLDDQKKFESACTTRGFSVIPVNIASGVTGITTEGP